MNKFSVISIKLILLVWLVTSNVTYAKKNAHLVPLVPVVPIKPLDPPNPAETLVTFYSEGFWGDSYSTNVIANSTTKHKFQQITTTQLGSSNLVVNGGSSISSVSITCRDHPASLVLYNGRNPYPQADRRYSLIISCQANETKRINLHAERTNISKCYGWTWRSNGFYNQWLNSGACNQSELVYWGDRVKSANILIHPRYNQSAIPLQTLFNFSHIISSSWNLNFKTHPNVVLADQESGLNRPFQLDLSILVGNMGGDIASNDPVNFVQLSSVEIQWKTGNAFTIHQEMFLSSGIPFVSGKRAWFEYNVIMNTVSGLPRFYVPDLFKIWIEGGVVYNGYGEFPDSRWYRKFRNKLVEANIPRMLEDKLNSAFESLPRKQNYYFDPKSFQSQIVELRDNTVTRFGRSPKARRPEWRFFLNSSVEDWTPIYNPIFK